MADRNTKVTLSLQVDQYLSGMDKAAKATREAGTEAEKLAQKKEAFNTLGVGALAFGAAVAAGVALAVKKFADFDQAMSNVQAATQETAENMGLLREAALDAGAETVYSATEAASAIEELGKAGLTTEEILSGGLNGALSLAAAGQLEVADAAQIAAIAVKQFGLAGKDVPHIADLLAAGAGKAVGDVSDLSQALNQAGLVAHGAGQSIEDTTGVLAAFADAGLLGSDAGTSLKTAIVALQAPTDKARAIMDEYNLSFYDGNGQMLSFDKIAGQLQSRLGGLKDETRNAALAQIFGNDALRSANVLYEQGAKGIQKYITQTNDSGYAAKVAADRLNNLSGDVEKLGGAFDTALIKSGSGANDMLRTLTQSATGVVDAIGDLPEPVLSGGLALAALVGSVGLAGGAALIAIPKIAAFKTALSTLNVSGFTVARSIGAISGVVAVAGFAFAAFADQQARVSASTRELQDSLDDATGAATDYTREIVTKKLAEGNVFKAAKAAGISQRELTDAVLEGGDALKKYQDALMPVKSSLSFAEAAGASQALSELNLSLDRSEENLKDEKAAADGSAASTETAADAYQSAADNAAALQSNLSTLIETVNEANGVGQDAVSANIDYQQALADVDEQISNVSQGVEGFGSGLDEATAAGRANETLLVDLAAKSQAAAKAQFDLDGNTENYKATLEAGRQAVEDRATALSGNADAAKNLADKIYAIPSETQFRVIAETAEAQRRLDAISSSLAAFQNSGVSLRAYVESHANGGTVGLAGGGTVYGPGTSKSDSILTRLSKGEEVIQEPYASMYRPLLKDINSGGYGIPRWVLASASLGGGSSSTHNDNRQEVVVNVAPTRDNDPATTARVLGREIARGMAK